ncbi:MAG: phenylalanine--tRNA ligase subunit alpha [bacterium]
MEKQLEKIKIEFQENIKKCDSLEVLEQIRASFLGRKGKLSLVLKDLKNLSSGERKELGQKANGLKEIIESGIAKKEREIELKSGQKDLEKEQIDITQPIIGKEELGHLHLLTQIQYEIEDIFKSMGFIVLDGPELESEYYNFEALNIPPWHPAREMQDTFYIENDKKENKNRFLMRTHTSSVQVRAMQKYGAPIRAIVPGKVFRNEATDARHDHTFHQVEGFMVGEDISMSNLFAILKNLLSAIFKKEIDIRIRPGYFPFVEPGIEVDLKCQICAGKGCGVCKKTGWVEFMGAGMIHPNVLKAGKIDCEKYQGFAFGFGLTRLILMKYGIDDIRLLMGGDLRFLKQF